MYRYKVMKRFNKQNCTSSVRAQITDKWGRTITLMGTHAFDWTIYVEESTGNMTITTCQKFSKGEQARKRFQELKKKR